MKYNSLHSIITTFAIVLLIVSNMTVTLAEEQETQECGFSIKDNKDRTYEVYIPESKTLNFESVNDLGSRELITISFGSISLLQVIKDNKEQTRVNITLKDGREFKELIPENPEFRIDGKIFIVDAFTGISGNILWDSIQEIKILRKEKPKENATWTEQTFSYSLIQFNNTEYLIPARNMLYYVKGKCDTELYEYITFSNIPPLIKTKGSRIQVDEYWAMNLSRLQPFLITIDGMKFSVPFEKISKLSQTEKVLFLTNSQTVSFNDVVIPPKTVSFCADTYIGRSIFTFRDIKCLEFADREPIWEDSPENEFIEYEVTNLS